jgi:hypothetical protein
VGNTNKDKSKNKKAASAALLITGSDKHFPSGSQPFTLGGVSMTMDQAKTELRSLVSNRSAVVAAQGSARSKVLAEDTQAPALNAFVSAFTAFVKLTFAGQAEVLADFGIKPPKVRTPMTAEQKAVAAAKRKATREARGTKGPKAKQAVHGDITAQLVVTPTAQPATPQTPATAPAAAPVAVTVAATPSTGTTTQHS